MVPCKMRFGEIRFEIQLISKFAILRETYPGIQNIYSCLAPEQVRHCSKTVLSRGKISMLQIIFQDSLIVMITFECAQRST